MTVNNKPNLPREAMPWARDIEAAVRRLEGNGSSLRSSLTATNNLAGSATSLAQAHTVQISETNAKLEENDAALAELNTVTLPGLDSQLSTLSTDLSNLDTNLTADLSALDGAVTQLDTDLAAADTRITTTQNNLTTVTNDLSTTKSSLATLRDTTVPAINTRLGTAESTLTTTKADTDALKNTTVPNLQTDLNTLNNTTIPDLNTALATKLPTATYDTNKTATDTRITNTETVANTANGLVQGWKVTGKTTIDGGKIEADSVKAAQIAAGTITAEKVVLSSTRSMIPWNVQYTYAPHVGQNGTQILNIKDSDANWVIEVKPGGSIADLTMGSAMRFMSGTTASNGQAGDFDVEPGAWYRFRVGVGVGGAFPSGPREVRITFAAYRQDGTFVWINSPIMDSMPFGRDTNNPTGLKYLDFQFQVPADVVVIRPFFQKNMWSGGSYFVSEPLLVRASSAELIVDGAITTDKLVANAVTAAKVAADAVYANAIQANAVVAGKIATDAVTANTIAANAVTAVKVEAGAITTDKMSANSINGDRITAGTLSALKIVSGSIDTLQLKAGAVTADKILAGTITGDKIAANTILARSILLGDFSNYWYDANAERPLLGFINVSGGYERTSNATTVGVTVAESRVGVVPGTKMRWTYTREDRDGSGNPISASNAGSFSLLARYFDATGTQTSFTAAAASFIGEPVYFTIPANAVAVEFGIRINSSVPSGRTVRVTNTQIRAMSPGTLIEDGAITTDKMIANTINGDRITTNTLSATKITSKSITAEQIQARAITATEIAANTITANEIKANTITSNEIAANTITANEIAVGAITADELSANAITGKTITGGTITGAVITGIELNGDWLDLSDGTTSGWEGHVGKGGFYSSWGATHPTYPSEIMAQFDVQYANQSSQPAAPAEYGVATIITHRLGPEGTQQNLNGSMTEFGKWSTFFNRPVSVTAADIEVQELYVKSALTVPSNALPQSAITNLTTDLANRSLTSHTHTGAQVTAATETARGTVELATAAETATGTDATRAVTPAGLNTLYRGSYRNVILDPDVGNAWQSIPSGTWSPLTLPSGSAYNILNTLNGGAAAVVSNGYIQVPRTGRYLVNTAIRWFGNTGGTARGVAIRVTASGPRQMEANQRVTSAGFPGYHMPMSTTAEVMANSGDQIQIVVTQNTGAALQCAMETFTISYLGPQ